MKARRRVRPQTVLLALIAFAAVTIAVLLFREQRAAEARREAERWQREHDERVAPFRGLGR